MSWAMGLGRRSPSIGSGIMLMWQRSWAKKSSKTVPSVEPWNTERYLACMPPESGIVAHVAVAQLEQVSCQEETIPWVCSNLLSQPDSSSKHEMVRAKGRCSLLGACVIDGSGCLQWQSKAKRFFDTNNASKRVARGNFGRSTRSGRLFHCYRHECKQCDRSRPQPQGSVIQNLLLTQWRWRKTVTRAVLGRSTTLGKFLSIHYCSKPQWPSKVSSSKEKTKRVLEQTQDLLVSDIFGGRFCQNKALLSSKIAFLTSYCWRIEIFMI